MSAVKRLNQKVNKMITEAQENGHGIALQYSYKCKEQCDRKSRYTLCVFQLNEYLNVCPHCYGKVLLLGAHYHFTNGQGDILYSVSHQLN